MTVVLTARTSKMTHEIDCEWCMAQEHNPNVKLIRRDSAVAPEWFTQRETVKTYYDLIGSSVPVCRWCGCKV